MQMRARRASGCALALASLVAAGGCGGGGDHANLDRPPATISITAAIAGGRIHVSPARFGAGPIRLIISNQTPVAQAVTFETNGLGSTAQPGITQTTQPIDPAGTTTLEVEVRKGAYALKTADRAIRAAAVQVGAPRPSAQNELLQP